MQFRLELTNVDDVAEALTTEVLAAGTRTVGDATRRLEKDFEALTRETVPGQAWRAWRSTVYPQGGKPAYDPVGTVFLNGGRRTKGMMSYWTQPGVNRATGGGWLAIPLRAAGSTGRSRHLTPRMWEQRTGLSLRIAYPGRNRATSAGWALLVTDGVLAKNKSGALKKRTRRRAQQGREKVTRAIFLLIPEQKHANRVSLAAAIQRSERYMAQSFARRIARLGRDL